MGKIGIIIWREYITRVRNKTFIIMSLLGPLLVAGFITLMVWIPNADKTEQKIMVIDESYAIRVSKLPDNKLIKFYYPETTIEDAQDNFYKTDFTAILHIDRDLTKDLKPILYCKKSPSFATENYIKTELEKKFFEWQLSANKIDPTIIKNSRKQVAIHTWKINEKGEKVETRNEIATLVGFFSGALILMFVLLYGMQVMRGVMEEKTSRIVEVIISSVKPFQLMLGKIIGVAFVGITQFIIWVILSAILTGASSSFFLKSVAKDADLMTEQKEIVYKQGSNADFSSIKKMNNSVEAIDALEYLKTLNIPQIAICFLLFFLGGYLLYSSLLAAIGSAVDVEADTQQFMLPIMLPLMVGYFIAFRIIQDPESSLVFWGSMIPLTSPIVMMARLPFGVPMWQIVLSLSLLVVSFLFTTWLAGKIYRTGILMYGKKTSWKEIGKWIFYKG